MNWDFLDDMNKNLLYTYASKLTKTGHNQGFYVPSNTGDYEVDEMLDAEEKRKSAYYLIWFVYRYVLKCETYEEAEKYATPEILNRYKLTTLFDHRKKQKRIYLGIYGVNEIYLYNYKNSDIGTILEILYNRYDYFEQLECFIRRAGDSSKKNRVRCIKAMKQTLEMIENEPRCRCYFERYGKGFKK